MFLNISNHPWVQFFLYGNYLYGVCAVALSVESAVQLGLQLPEWGYFGCIGAGTIYFYTLSYTQTPIEDFPSNSRTQWYEQQRGLVRRTQLCWIGLCAFLGLVFIGSHRVAFFQLLWSDWAVFLTFPVLAICYDLAFFPRLSLRRIGYFKPFVIGCVWAGIVTCYPFLYARTVNASLPISQGGFLLFFVQNWLFISILCILFDIKDTEDDSKTQLKTFANQYGRSQTILQIVTPLSGIGIGIWIFAAVYSQDSHVLLLAAPYGLLLVVANSLRRDRSILYYLICVDGLMLVKAVWGIWVGFK